MIFLQPCIFFLLLKFFNVVQSGCYEEALSNNASSKANECNTIPFLMFIEEEECEMKTVLNNYCKGFCCSVTMTNEDGKELKRISSCQPEETYKKVVFLNCKNKILGKELLYTKTVEVEIYKKCKCQTYVNQVN